MKAKWQAAGVKNVVKVDILAFINDGYAIIRKQHGWLDVVLVSDLRVLEGDLNDRQN